MDFVIICSERDVKDRTGKAMVQAAYYVYFVGLHSHGARGASMWDRIRGRGSDRGLFSLTAPYTY